jgi:hypothetical protein
MTEKQLQGAVVELAKRLGYLVYHTFDSRRSNPGWPDLVLCKPPRLIFAELKVGSRKLTADQEMWLDALGKCAAATGLRVGDEGRPEGYLWTDKDWQAGEVETVLR